MALRVAGYVVIGGTTPSEDPVTRGYIWMDTATDKLKICTSVSPYTFAEISGAGGAVAWGDITGTVSDQLDLQAELNDKADIIHQHGVTDLILADNFLVGKVTGAISDTNYVSLGSGLEFELFGAPAAARVQVDEAYLDTLYAALAHTHPQSDVTNLVSDLAAIGAFLTSVTAILTEMQGGTAGTILTKTTGTDFDMQWSRIDDAGVVLVDVLTNNSSTTKHGFLKKLSNVATEFMDGTGNWDSIKDSDLSTTDITANDATTAKHGFMQKYPNTKYQVLRGDGTFASTFKRDSPQGWEWSSYSATGFTGMSFIRARGTEAVPLRTKSGDLVASLAMYGYNAADDVTTAALNGNSSADMSFYASAAHTAASRPGKIVFSTTPVGSTATPSERWTIGDDGGLTATAPAYLNVKLDDLIAADDTTDLDSSTARHGLLKKLSNVATEFMNGVGAWSTVTATVAVLVGPKNLVSTVEAIAADTFVHVGRQLEIAATGSIEIPSTSTLEITP